MNATYTSRDEAIYREVIEPLANSEQLDPNVDPFSDQAAFDVAAIADEVLGDHASGYAIQVDTDTFWGIVGRHARD